MNPPPTRTVSEPALDRRSLRLAFSSFATGVTVVTVGGGQPHGMTANSFASVSLDPPLLLVCVGHAAIMHSCLSTADGFGVSVLAADQARVARYFADPARPMGARQFDEVDWTPGRRTGAPLLGGALATFECAPWRSYAGGDHSIFLGLLLGMDWKSEGEGLVFHHGAFRNAPPEGS